MEERKFCPLKQSLTVCRYTDCALWIKKPGTEGCALVVLSEAMEEAASHLFDIAANGGT